MSMELGVKHFTTEPNDFIAGSAIGITTAAKKANETLKAYAPVFLSGGKVTKVASTTDLKNLYGITADSAESGKDAVIYLTGEFFADKLALESGVKAADLEVAFRNIGIILK